MYTQRSGWLRCILMSHATGMGTDSMLSMRLGRRTMLVNSRTRSGERRSEENRPLETRGGSPARVAARRGRDSTSDSSEAREATAAPIHTSASASSAEAPRASAMWPVSPTSAPAPAEAGSEAVGSQRTAVARVATNPVP